MFLYVMKYHHNIPIHCSKSTELETSSSAQIVTIKHGYCLKYKYWTQKTQQQLFAVKKYPVLPKIQDFCFNAGVYL